MSLKSTHQASALADTSDNRRIKRDAKRTSNKRSRRIAIARLVASIAVDCTCDHCDHCAYRSELGVT